MHRWTPYHRDAALRRVDRLTAGVTTLGVLSATALGAVMAMHPQSTAGDAATVAASTTTVNDGGSLAAPAATPKATATAGTGATSSGATSAGSTSSGSTSSGSSGSTSSGSSGTVTSGGS